MDRLDHKMLRVVDQGAREADALLHALGERVEELVAKFAEVGELHDVVQRARAFRALQTETAREEGFEDLAVKFEEVAKIEKSHEERYRKLLKNVEDKKVFSKDGDVIWACRNCGHIVIGKDAPEVCPVCNHPQAYFEIKPENYIINLIQNLMNHLILI